METRTPTPTREMARVILWWAALILFCVNVNICTAQESTKPQPKVTDPVTAAPKSTKPASDTASSGAGGIGAMSMQLKTPPYAVKVPPQIMSNFALASSQLETIVQTKRAHEAEYRLIITQEKAFIKAFDEARDAIFTCTVAYPNPKPVVDKACLAAYSAAGVDMGKNTHQLSGDKLVPVPATGTATK